MRIYLPSTWSGLEQFLQRGELRPRAGVGFGVTPDLQREYPASDDEELEYLAMQDAGRGALRLLAGAGDDEPALRVVIAADIGDERTVPRPDKDRAALDIEGSVRWTAVTAVHVDGADAQDAVRAAAGAVDAAEFGDDDAQFLLGSAEDYELAWYAPSEVRYLLDDAGESPGRNR